MKIKLLKIGGIISACLAGLALAAASVYVILNYPGKGESFEINMANPSKKILIAAQGSDFKNMLVKSLCDSMKNSSVYIKGIDAGKLDEMNEKDWDRILIISTFMIRLNKTVNRFVNRAVSPENILLFVTSGGADWQPQPELKVEAITSASKRVNIQNLVDLISNWIRTDENQDWESRDYLLALKYSAKVNVNAVCEAIGLEQERYKVMYRDLAGQINSIGYQFLRLKNIKSALEVFRLSVNLFPDSWNVYDSYGEALLMSGDREAAIRNYRKSLELNPGSESSKKMLEKLLKN